MSQRLEKVIPFHCEAIRAHFRALRDLGVIKEVAALLAEAVLRDFDSCQSQGRFNA